MLKCREIARNCGDYVEEELPLRKLLGMHLHLLMCRKCRRLVAHLRAAVAGFHHYSMRELPREEAERITRRIEERARDSL